MTREEAIAADPRVVAWRERSEREIAEALARFRMQRDSAEVTARAIVRAIETRPILIAPNRCLGE